MADNPKKKQGSTKKPKLCPDKNQPRLTNYNLRKNSSTELVGVSTDANVSYANAAVELSNLVTLGTANTAVANATSPSLANGSRPKAKDFKANVLPPAVPAIIFGIDLPDITSSLPDNVSRPSATETVIANTVLPLATPKLAQQPLATAMGDPISGETQREAPGKGADSMDTGTQVPKDFWAKMDERLALQSATDMQSMNAKLAEMTVTITKSVEANLASKFQALDTKVLNLDKKIGLEVGNVRTALNEHIASAPTPGEMEGLKARVAALEEKEKNSLTRVVALEEKEKNSLARIQSLEENNQAALTRTEALEGQVSLITEVAIGVIDHARGMADHITDVEGRSRRGNLRIYNVEEGYEKDSSVPAMVEDMVKEHLEIDDFEIERAHRSAGRPSHPGQQPRSIVVKFTKEKDQEKILRKAWDLKGVVLNGKRIGFGRDNANAVQDRINSFRGTKKKLQDQKIRFHTGQWGQLVVFYTDPTDETETYWTTYEAFQGMSLREIDVDRVEPPIDLVEELKRESWSTQGQEARTREAFKKFVGGQQLGRRRGPGARKATSRPLTKD